jgi:hypothetical protein
MTPLTQEQPQVTQEQLIQIVACLPAYFDQNAQFQRDAAQFQRDAAQFQKEQAAKMEFVCAKLEIIEKNTITIMGAIVTDFAGVSGSQKTVIEVTGNAVNADVVREHVLNPQFTRRVTRLKSGELREKLVATPSFKLTTLFKQLGVTDHGIKCASGNWVGSILSKIFGLPMNRKYHPSLAPLVGSLLDYYFVERSPESRMY